MLLVMGTLVAGLALYRMPGLGAADADGLTPAARVRQRDPVPSGDVR